MQKEREGKKKKTHQKWSKRFPIIVVARLRSSPKSREWMFGSDERESDSPKADGPLD